MLMLVGVFVRFANILLRFLVEGFLTSERTEVIGLAFIFGLASGGRGIDVHAANGIVHSCCHRLSPSIDLIITLTDTSTESYITQYLVSIFAYYFAMLCLLL